MSCSTTQRFSISGMGGMAAPALQAAAAVAAMALGMGSSGCGYQAAAFKVHLS